MNEKKIPPTWMRVAHSFSSAGFSGCDGWAPPPYGGCGGTPPYGGDGGWFGGIVMVSA